MYYSLEDIAKMYGVALNTVNHWRKTNEEIEKLFYRTTRQSNLSKATYSLWVINEEDIEKFKEIVNKKKKNKECRSSSANYRGWTKTSLECYERQCVCNGCILEEMCNNNIPKIYGKPPIKWKVIELIKKYGAPYETQTENIEL